MEPVRLQIEIEVGSRPPRGRIGPAGSELPFEGWMALNQALERARRGELGSAPAGAPDLPVAEEE